MVNQVLEGRLQYKSVSFKVFSQYSETGKMLHFPSLQNKTLSCTLLMYSNVKLTEFLILKTERNLTLKLILPNLSWLACEQAL